MKISVISVPVNNKVSEPFLMPNMTLSIMASELIKEKHEVQIIDLEKLWFSEIKYELSKEEKEILSDLDKATKKNKKTIELGRKIAKISGILETDILAVSFTDLRPEPLSLALPFLIGLYLKNVKKDTRIVTGGYGLGYYAHLEIMKKFKIYDYAVYSKNGAASLLNIIEKIKGKNVSLFETIERKGKTFINHKLKLNKSFNPTPYYSKQLIKQYEYDDKTILSKYNPSLITKKLISGKKYIVVPYIFELYCPNKCAFCEQNINKPNLKSISQVIDEILELKNLGVNGIYFVNSSFNNHYKYTEELCEKIIKYKLDIKWMDCASFINIDENLLNKMKKAGAIKLTWGVESASSKMLNYINKNTTVEKISNFLKYSHNLGITNHIELIAGLPYETSKDIEKNLDFIRKHSKYIDIYTLNSFYLYSNSYFFINPDTFGIKIKPYRNLEKMNFFPKDSRTSVGRFSHIFDEINGLKWEDKNKQIIKSTQKIVNAISKYSGLKRFGNEHIHLLFMLYDKLGYNKPLIKKISNILTKKFIPYNLDFYLEDFDDICHKHEETRILLPKSKSLSII